MPRDEQPQRARHVAIIMDGNGRWARARGLRRLAGHRQGVEAVRKIVEACPDLGIRQLTLYAFSTENWKRSTEEIDGLMTLFRRYMAREAARLLREDVRLRFIGSRDKLPADIVKMMDDLEQQSAGDKKFTLTIALNYGGRDEIARATRRIAAKVATGEIDPDDVTEQTIAANLDWGDIGDPCLVVRTSGEYRISNFLLWQAAYSEFEFVDTYWPDFTPDMLASLLDRFGQRERRFGAAAG